MSSASPVTILSSALVTTAHSSLFARSLPMRRTLLLAAATLQITLTQAALNSLALAQTQIVQPHNAVLFIADGLRFRMVDDNTAPTMATMARQGASLRNGHALFPPFTIAQAS